MENILKGKRVLITAGPTREYLDPVRFITNESSGKMGYAIAQALHELGAMVSLVSGPVSIKPEIAGIHIIHVTTANEMAEACKQLFMETEIAIFSAAVAYYRPKYPSNCKIKKAEEVFVIFDFDVINLLNMKHFAKCKVLKI